MKKDLLGFEFHSHSSLPTKYLNFYSDSRKSLRQNPHKSYKWYCQFHVCSWLLSADQLVVIPLCWLRCARWLPGDQHQAPGPVLRACRPHHYNIITPVHWSPSTRHPVITTWRIDMKNNLPRMLANDTHLSSLSLQCQWRSPLPLKYWSNCRWPGDRVTCAQGLSVG